MDGADLAGRAVDSPQLRTRPRSTYGSGTQLMALEALSGSALWRVEVGFPQMLSPMARADDLLIGS